MTILSGTQPRRRRAAAHGCADCGAEDANWTNFSSPRRGEPQRWGESKLDARGAPAGRSRITTSRVLLIAGMLAAMMLPGCQDKPPVPPPSLPSLERPVLTLRLEPDALSTLTILRPALIERGGIPGVFVLENNQARFRMVRPGKTIAARVEVLSGLHGDEILVLGDLAEVHDGSPISIK